MRNDSASDLCRMASATRDWTASWDQRRRELVFARSTSENDITISLGLESLGEFQHDVQSLSPAQAASLRTLLEDWPIAASELEEVFWLAPLERLACFLAASQLACRFKFRCSLNRFMHWLRAQGSSQIWLQRYNDSLPYASRYRLLHLGVKALREDREAEREGSKFADVSNRETREIFWFTVRLQHSLAKEWFDRNGISSVEAARAHRQSHLAYLQVLRDEPYRRELEIFLQQQKGERERRSGTESEVARLLQLGVNIPRASRRRLAEQSLPGSVDEAVDGIFFSWFMQRYDQSSGRRLMWRGLRQGEKRATIVSMVLALLSAGLFAFQVFHRDYTLVLPGGRMLWLTTLQMWMFQVGLQVTALMTAAWFAPKCFNFVLPRALFGSLLTWITLVLTSLPGLWAIELEGRGSRNLREMIHDFMVQHPLSALVALPIALLAAVFIVRQIGQWTDDRGLILRRGILTTVKLYLGSLFWGVLFAVPIRSVIEKETEQCLSCLLPIACVGASLAALFGIIVELVWEDKSIAEPLEDPL